MLAESSAIDGYGFLSLQPKTLSLSDIRFENKTAFVDLNLTVQPTFTTEKPLQKEAKLPNLSEHTKAKGFNIELDAIATYDSLSSIMTKAIQGQSVMIKNNEVAMVINTVEERRNAIADSRHIRTSALLNRVTTFTTIAGAEAAVQGMKSMDNLDVISVQEMHAQLTA